VAAIATERQRFAAGLAAAGWRPEPSVTNFILVRLGEVAAADRASDRLLRAGLVPRTFGPDHPLAGCLRLTVRSPAEDDRLLEAIGS
jgi:histidinol-phosphate aminotransferase